MTINIGKKINITNIFSKKQRRIIVLFRRVRTARCISLDQAIDSLIDITNRLVETTFSLEGTLDIVIPATSKPSNYIQYIELF